MVIGLLPQTHGRLVRRTTQADSETCVSVRVHKTPLPSRTERGSETCVSVRCSGEFTRPLSPHAQREALKHVDIRNTHLCRRTADRPVAITEAQAGGVVVSGSRRERELGRERAH